MTHVAQRGKSEIASVLLMGGMLGLVGCSQAPVAAPTSYADFNHKEGTFACEYPEGWEETSGGKRGPHWATFKSGPATIRLNADLAGSLMGDAMGGRQGDADLPPEMQPVHRIHVDGKRAAEDEYSGYQEVGQPREIDVSLGPARVSEFTATTTFGSGLHGYRATVLGHNRRVVAFCICPESDWKALQPAFDHVLSTLKRGFAEQ